MGSSLIASNFDIKKPNQVILIGLSIRLMLGLRYGFD